MGKNLFVATNWAVRAVPDSQWSKLNERPAMPANDKQVGIHMDANASVTSWIEGLRRDDPRSAQELWERYFEKLVALARQKLPSHVRREFDEEDVALSALDTICRGMKQDRFPQLRDDDNLWPLLVVITARKAMHRLRDATARKRGGGNVKGESVFEGSADHDAIGIGQVLGDEPTPELAMQMAEESEQLLELLPDDSMRQLAVLKMEGHFNEEIARHLECGLRTVER